MQRFGLLTLLVVLACEPTPPSTTSDSTSDPGTTATDSTSDGVSSAGPDASTADETTGANTSDDVSSSGDASTGSDIPTGGGGACECAPASPEFCTAVVDLCKSHGLNFPHPDFCAAYAEWCTEGTSGDTCSTCTFLQATCDDFAPEPASCAGLYDTCSCLS